MILGIESSCDESALALFCPDRGILFEKVHSQITLHQEYGGVVPDLASREHLVNFPLLLEELFQEHSLKDVKEIALTTGPGLAACLAIGTAWAKSLRLRFHCPVYAVNHLRGHLYSPLIQIHERDPRNFQNNIEPLFPQLHLLASGGNTQLVELTISGQVKVLAETIDDAAGEALDKGGKLLGLPYPAGPILEKKAQAGDPSSFSFPRSFRSVNDPKFSFSGLKTSLRYQLEKMTEKEVAQQINNLSASYQIAVIDALINKTAQFLSKNKFSSLGLSGGVSNNQLLRDRFEVLGKKHKLPVLFAKKKHTGDNATMIAFAYFMEKNLSSIRSEIKVSPNWRIDQIAIN